MIPVLRGMIGPARPEVMPLQCPSYEGRGLLRAFQVNLIRKHRRRYPMVFDVINVEPQSLQANQVMDCLPNDTTDRHRCHYSEQDNDWFAVNVHNSLDSI